MSWIYTTVIWYVYLLILGLIFFPVSSIILRKLYDYGYGFSKVVGIIVLSFIVLVLGILHIVPFSQAELFAILGVIAVAGLYHLQKNPLSIDKKRLAFILFQEAIFIISLFFWVYVRGQEPSIRGLEKFMDFGFMNSIARSSYFPPSDMWLAGKSINYYYFGHLSGAVLTKLSGIAAFKTYNLILATIFALSITQTFSLAFTLFVRAFEKKRAAFAGALLAVFLLNFGGNLHTMYSFTKGYPNEKPAPVWSFSDPKIGCFVQNDQGVKEWKLFCPQTYWYPNATRFIPFTIHEFPIYSYVVADLHGHVFDIPFVLLTLAILLHVLLYSVKTKHESKNKPKSIADWKTAKNLFISLSAMLKSQNKFLLFNTILLGFLTSVNYMTNAFDGPIYVLLTILILLYLFGISVSFIFYSGVLAISFVVFSLPFSTSFAPFVSGIGVNCAPGFLIAIQKMGPFLFEKDNCQISSWWMLATLWGFFWFNFIFLIFAVKQKSKHSNTDQKDPILQYMLILFGFSTILLLIPEFFYIKDIYPAHFRANTMFKLGYQAFMMMSFASAFTLLFYKHHFKKNLIHIIYIVVFIFFFILVAIYPFFAINSYYGKLAKTPQLDGSLWISTSFPEYYEIIHYLNNNVKNQPTILEAQGDSYTDFNVVSSYTGLPTVAGWLVHEWLWRGDASVVSNIAPDIQTIYETDDEKKTIELIKKYNVTYVVVGPNERQKYTNLKEEKFERIGEKIFTSKNESGKIYKMR